MLRAKPPSCQGCPLETKGKGFVPPVTPPTAKVYILGHSPTQDEFLDGEPFTGAVGRKLDYWLASSGLSRSDCSLGHVIQCWDSRVPAIEPDPRAVAHCRAAHWESRLAGARPRVVVPMGIAAAKAVLGRRTKENSIGVRTRAEVGGVPITVLPLLHPTNITRGRWSDEPAQIAYLKQVRDILDGTQPEAPDDFSTPAPVGGEYVAAPGLPELHRFTASIGPQGLAVDIETAGDHLRTVGLYSCDGGGYLSFPVRDVGGAQYWNAADLPTAIEWLFDLLSDPGISKVFHNGQAFDVPVLERNGFVVEGYDFDTMLAAHVAFPGTPKGLEELSKSYLRVGGWKAIVRDDDSTGEGK